MAGPTPFLELNRVLAELALGVRALLGRDLVGLYLQGSFAGGDFDVYSDVDFLAVVQSPVSPLQREALQALHRRIYEMPTEWARHLEGSYMPLDLLRAWDRCQETVPYIDNGSRDLVDSVHDNTLVVRWVVREQGIALAGPPARELLDPIPGELLRREVLETMEVWGAELLADPARMNNRWYQPFVVLSYCRMLHTLHTGTVTSKLAASRWAQETLDEEWQDLIRRAWEARPHPGVNVGRPADPVDLQRTRSFMGYTTGLGRARMAVAGSEDSPSISDPRSTG